MSPCVAECQGYISVTRQAGMFFLFFSRPLRCLSKTEIICSLRCLIKHTCKTIWAERFGKKNFTYQFNFYKLNDRSIDLLTHLKTLYSMGNESIRCNWDISNILKKSFRSEPRCSMQCCLLGDMIFQLFRSMNFLVFNSSGAIIEGFPCLVHS